MKVIYSIGSKFGGHGIGAQAAHAVRGIHRARALKKVLASYNGSSKIKNQKSKSQFKTQNSGRGIPKKYVKTMGILGKGLRRLAYYDPTGWGYVLHDNVFDRWAASQLETCDIFHGWNHHCLHQIRGVKSLKGVRRRETITVVERASSHILQSQKILKEEFRKYDVNASLLPQTYVGKCLKEYDEADYILVPSDYAKQSFLERGFDERKIFKIPFGVDVAKFKILNPNIEAPNKSQILNSKHEKFIVLYVGDVRLGKGVQYLLEGWGELRLKDAELWLVGDIKPDIKKVLAKYRNHKDIKRLGFVRNISEVMKQANVFAFPSLDEGGARVTYEAMASGLPVITTPNAGSLVQDSLDGYIIPIRDPEALAERLQYFYKYPEQAKVMGERGRERIKEFTWERYGENLVKAYIKMLKST